MQSGRSGVPNLLFIFFLCLAVCACESEGSSDDSASDATALELDTSLMLAVDSAASADQSAADSAPVLPDVSTSESDSSIPDMATPSAMDLGFFCSRDFECNDRNPCTDDVCAEGQCENTPNQGTCDDGLFCNGVEQCVDGECVAGDIPCPRAEDCDPETSRCTACEDQSHCPSPDVVRETACQFEGVCDEQGQNIETVATYACTEGVCTSTTEDRDAMCERDSDGIPCGGGVMCLDGSCPRDPLVRVVSSGYVNFNARFSAYCQATNQSCIVQGNRDRQDRGSMDMYCELTCPEESNVQFCCSNGSVPCEPNGRLAPRAGVTIDSVVGIGFTDTTCNVNPGVGQPVECLSIMGAGDARVECSFRRQ